MMNYVSPGDHLTITAPFDLTAGQFVGIGNLCGVTYAPAATGKPVTIATTGVFKLPKPSGDAWSTGATIYWHPDTRELNTSSTMGGVKAGVVTTAAPTGTTVAEIRLG